MGTSFCLRKKRLIWLVMIKGCVGMCVCVCFLYFTVTNCNKPKLCLRLVDSLTIKNFFLVPLRRSPEVRDLSSFSYLEEIGNSLERFWIDS